MAPFDLVLSIAEVVSAATTSTDGGALEILGADGVASTPTVVGLTAENQWVAGELARRLPTYRTVRPLHWWDGAAVAQIGPQRLTGVEYVALVLASVRARVRPDDELSRLTILVPSTNVATLQDDLAAALPDIDVRCRPTAVAAAHCALDHLPVLTGGTFPVIDWRGGEPDVTLVQRYASGFTLIPSTGRTCIERSEIVTALAALSEALVPDAPWILCAAAGTSNTVLELVHEVVGSARTMPVDIEQVVLAAAQSPTTKPH